MKLEELLGEALYGQVKEKLEEANQDEPDKLKHIRYADLSEGEYVSKPKYDSLSELLAGKETELDTANGLIAELKKKTNGDENIQSMVADYEAQVAELQEKLHETNIKSALKVALLSEKAVDVEYLTFKLNEKLKEKNETLKLDDNGNIKGWEDKLSGLKTQFPSMFDTAAGGGENRIIEPNRLPDSDNNAAVTREQFSAMNYEQRLKLKRENEQMYRNLSKK